MGAGEGEVYEMLVFGADILKAALEYQRKIEKNMAVQGKRGSRWSILCHHDCRICHDVKRKDLRSWRTEVQR